MGNETSAFEEQFHKLYNFIALVEDPYFRQAKVYRKNRHNYNHIMVVEQPIVHLAGTTPLSAKAFLTEKLALIRRFQNRYTVHLEYFHLLEQRKYECGLPAVRMYIDYYNYTLQDYLTALRMKKQPLAIEELILVVQSLAEAILTLRKMGLDNYRITLTNIFLIVEDGVVLLNPVYLLYDALAQTYNARTIHTLTQDYHPLPREYIQPREHYRTPHADSTVLLQQQQKQQLHSIIIEMAPYLSQKCLGQTERLLNTLQQCHTITEVATTFVCSIEELNVQQFGESSEEAPQLY